MNIFIRFLGSLLLSGFAFAEKQETLLTHPMSKEQCHYIITQRVYKDPKEVFQEVHGDPQKSALILLIYTSLACPVCAEIEIKVLPAILGSSLMKEGHLSIIIRDYPADPLSLRAAAAAWANPEKAGHFRKHLFQRAHDPEKTWTTHMNALKEAALEACECEEEKKKVTEALDKTDLMKKIFQQRIQDKSILKIEEVPTGWIVIKKKPKEKDTNKEERLLKLEALPELEELPQFMEYLKRLAE